MLKSIVSRRAIVEGGIGFTLANFVPGTSPLAFAATMEERTVAAGKAAGAADLSGMIWSPYLVPMQPVIAEFKKQTGIGVGAVQDISIFDAPQRAMAEALSRSPQLDFIHIDSNMIPSLASAGYLEPLDEYMKKAEFKIDAVADYANFMTYKGQTYGIPTDGNVHIQYVRKDLLQDDTNKKRFADKHGKPLEFPATWEDDLRIQETLMDPSKDLYGSGNLRNRANGPTWWYMIFYSAGGFTFDDDMNPTLDTPAGHYAVDIYLQDKKVAHPEFSGLGHPADDSTHRARARGELSVLGRNREAQRESRKVEDCGQMALWPGAGVRFLRQAHPSLNFIALGRAAHQQIQPAQGPGSLSRALARIGQEQHSHRFRSRQHLQRCVGEGTHDGSGGHEGV